jgi:hypothetical protein
MTELVKMEKMDAKVGDVEKGSLSVNSGSTRSAKSKPNYDQIINSFHTNEREGNPQDIKWANINFSVKVPGANENKVILKNCWGRSVNLTNTLFN